MSITTSLWFHRLWPVALILVLVFVAEAMGSGGKDDEFNPFNQPPKFCPNYRCSKGYEPAPKWPLKFTSSGCSSIMGGMGMTMFNPGADEKNDPLKSCCALRHACYQICGLSKKYCDESFKTCGNTTCEALPDDGSKAKEDCSRQVNIYDLMLGLQQDACRPYETGQAAACQCIKPEKVLDTRKQVLRSFYKKHSPDGLDKVDGLAAKADTSAKFAGLLYKLVAKYPKAIVEVEDPQKSQFDKMFKEAEKGGAKKPVDTEEFVDDDDDDEVASGDERIEL